jgi:hypothetical protein
MSRPDKLAVAVRPCALDRPRSHLLPDVLPPMRALVVRLSLSALDDMERRRRKLIGANRGKNLRIKPGVPRQSGVEVRAEATAVVELVDQLKENARAEPPDQFALPPSAQSGIGHDPGPDTRTVGVGTRRRPPLGHRSVRFSRTPRLRSCAAPWEAVAACPFRARAI